MKFRRKAIMPAAKSAFVITSPFVLFVFFVVKFRVADGVSSL